MDYIVRATAADHQIRAFAATTKDIVESGRVYHNTSPVATAALVGMIPNCAASVLITQLYISGLLDSGAMFAGLLCGAGTGLLVLFRENPDKKENLRLLAVLYVSGVAAGLLLGAIHIL